MLTFISHLSWVETLGLKGLEPNTFMKHSFYNRYAINTMYTFHTTSAEGNFLENTDVHYVYTGSSYNAISGTWKKSHFKSVICSK